MEDFEPFRALIRSLLKDIASIQIVGEATDGLTAVDNAQELLPDLILMDIGLPGLNGIEAARRIRSFHASSKIVFVSQETAFEVIQEALSLGLCGYILKSAVSSDLLRAIDAVLQGSQYLCGWLAGRYPAAGSDLDEQ